MSVGSFYNQTPQEIITFPLLIGLTLKASETGIAELLVKTKLAVSKSDTKRLIQGGGIKLDGVAVSDIYMEVTAGEHVVSREKQIYKGENKIT